MIRSAESIADSTIGDFVESAFRQIFDDCGGKLLLDLSKPLIWTDHDGAPTAFLVYSYDVEQRFLWIDLLFVREDQRSRGVGTSLLAYLLDSVRQTPGITVACEVNARRRVIKHLLRKHGFHFESSKGPFLSASRRI